MKSLRVTSVVDSAPLWVVADILTAGSFDAVVVFQSEGAVLGFALTDSVLRVAARLSTAPVGMLPLGRVAEVLPVLLSRGGGLNESGALAAQTE